MKTRYVVQGEHTLGYIYEERPAILNFLRCSVLRNSPYNDMNGFTVINPKDPSIRNATPADFENFRVVLPPNFQHGGN